MEIKLDFMKSLEVNASRYYELAKKFRKKRERALVALETLRTKEVKAKKDVQRAKRKKRWYDCYHWFISSDNVLCVGGRNADSNERLVKQHVAPEETVLHATFSGSPFFVIKGEAKKATIEQAAIATASFSQAWKLGMASGDVMILKGKQLHSKGKHGESLPKGSFYVKGKHDTITVPLAMGVAILDGTVICAPLAALTKAEKVIKLRQGKKTKEQTAKRIARMLRVQADDVQYVLPSGGFA